jgi:hypothetical protein
MPRNGAGRAEAHGEGPDHFHGENTDGGLGIVIHIMVMVGSGIRVIAGIVIMAEKE